MVMKIIHSFGYDNAYAHLTGTRCKPWDNMELDMLDGIKYYSFMLYTVG
jgi:hypothetical protein